MTSGQPKAKIAADQCQKLALSLRERRLKHNLPAALNLFNIGRVCAGAGVFLLLASFWCSGTGGGMSPQLPFLIPAIAAALSALLIPILLFALIQGARLGLFGLAEFICGLCYLPTKLLGGVEFQRMSIHMLGLLYSGIGRFDEAVKCFVASETNRIVFTIDNGTPWNTRHRLPELLARLGRTEEACDLTQHYCQQGRRDLQDIECPNVRANLQCDLIVAALVLKQSGQDDKVGPHLEEAIALGENCDRLDTLPASDEIKKLTLYAGGLLAIQRLDYQGAIESFEQCCNIIIEQRKSAKSKSSTKDSDLFGLSQIYLGQCYLKVGQSDKLGPLLTKLTQDYRTEPPGSSDKVLLDLMEADFKTSQGDSSGALAILEKTILTLVDSDAPYDRLLVEASQKYIEILESCGRQHDASNIYQSIKRITSAGKTSASKASDDNSSDDRLGDDRTSDDQASVDRTADDRANSDRTRDHETSLQKLAAQPKTAPLLPATKPLPPHLGATKYIANRSVIFFVAVLSYTVFKTLTHSANLDVVSWGMITALALIVCARSVSYQVRLRKANFFAGQALSNLRPVDVVLKPEGQLLPGVALKNCLIAEGPADLLGRKLEIGISNNLVYTSQVCFATGEGKIKARLYQSETSGKVLAIETLGRVLTVNKELPAKASSPR